MIKIIGREREIEELMRLYHKKQAQLVAVYGRRRVGKTYLVRELFKNHFAFYHTGVSPLELEESNLLEAQLFYQQACDKRTDAFADHQIKLLEYRHSVGQ